VGYQIVYNGQTYKIGYTNQQYSVVTNGGYTVVPVIDLSSYLKIQNVFAGTGIGVNYSVTGVTISNLGTGTITGATNGLSVAGKKIKLGGALTGNTNVNLNSGNLNLTGGTFFLKNTGLQIQNSTGATIVNVDKSSGEFRLFSKSTMSTASRALTVLLPNGATGSTISNIGTQNWYMYNTSSTAIGSLGYTTPGGVGSGIVFFNPAATQRYDITNNVANNVLNIYNAITPTATKVSIGVGTAGNPTATLQVRGGSQSNEALRIESSGGTATLQVLGNGTSTHTGQLNVIGTGSNPTLKTVGAGTTTNYSRRSFQSDGTTEIYSLQDSGLFAHTTTIQGSSIGGSWTATANDQSNLNFGGTFTSQNVVSGNVKAYQFTPTINKNASNPSSQVLTALFLNPIFGNASNTTTQLLRIANSNIDRVVIDGAGNLSVNTNNLNNPILSLQSTAGFGSTNPTRIFRQGKTVTTGATTITMQTIAIAANTITQVKGYVTARRTGGSSGSNEDGAGFEFSAVYKNISGSSAVIGTPTITVVGRDQAGWSVSLTPSSNLVNVMVTGAVNNNISWGANVETFIMST
jgi:hypothetical protein